MEQLQRSSSDGSGDSLTCSPSFSDSPMSITPAPSAATFTCKSIADSPGDNASSASTRRSSTSSAGANRTQIDSGLLFTVHRRGADASVEEAKAFITPAPSSRTRSTATLPVDVAALEDAMLDPPSGTANTPSDSDDAVVGREDTVCYPSFTPRKGRGTPSFTNPLYDVHSPCMSPWTQPLSATTQNSPLASGRSHASPTRRLFSVSSARYHHTYRRRHLQRRVEDRATAPHSPDGATASAAILAASSLLYRMALRGRSTRSIGLEGSVTGYLRRQLEGFGDDVSPQRSNRISSGRQSIVEARLNRNQDGIDEDSDPDGFSCGSGGRVCATLDLMDRAAALQRQLVVRTEELTAVRLQLEEAAAARDEMGLHLLDSQEHIASLERQLEESGRARVALAAQSELLQQQLQEACESLHKQPQTVLDALLGCSGQQHGIGPAQIHVHQVPGYSSSTGDSACPPPATLLISGAEMASSTQQGSNATFSLQYERNSQGVTTCDRVPFYCGHQLTSTVAGGDDLLLPTLGSKDPRDMEVAALRRENSFLTQRLIESSMALAHAREQEEDARHKAHMLQELNQQYVEMVNTMSLELSLLRPAACGRARGVFSLSSFLRMGSVFSGGAAASTSARG
ncbi:hypothetical protein Vretimale_18868 [Volvox reticuliferus]|uniref:Uncharacterized protein n=1 Tax=Volvox reticuliferus TaxID=1737510 RepID=A0A8J4D0D2_9CHLO|nr:hypothetical protein Vretifemale_18908 [Volvox reticuliferus]GIM16196.1 hypothetical protein Vretimale_18868 [Volvox reticuliferus]